MELCPEATGIEAVTQFRVGSVQGCPGKLASDPIQIQSALLQDIYLNKRKRDVSSQILSNLLFVDT